MTSPYLEHAPRNPHEAQSEMLRCATLARADAAQCVTEHGYQRCMALARAYEKRAALLAQGVLTLESTHADAR